jgi:signal transduction histidine kinase
MIRQLSNVGKRVVAGALTFALMTGVIYTPELKGAAVVKDPMAGMSKEELNNIKEMFFTTKKNGTGLGVALSNEIILAHNGVISYDSILGKGTKCVIKLPI